jgi:hypothetical protein
MQHVKLVVWENKRYDSLESVTLWRSFCPHPWRDLLKTREVGPVVRPKQITWLNHLCIKNLREAYVNESDMFLTWQWCSRIAFYLIICAIFKMSSKYTIFAQKWHLCISIYSPNYILAIIVCLCSRWWPHKNCKRDTQATFKRTAFCIDISSFHELKFYDGLFYPWTLFPQGGKIFYILMNSNVLNIFWII